MAKSGISFAQRFGAAYRAAKGKNPEDTPQASTHPDEMGFLDHLEELRWRIIKSIVAVALASIVCFFFADWVINQLLLAPTRSDFYMYRFYGMDAVDIVLQNRTITGQFYAYLGTVFAAGLIIGSPLVVYQFWKFLEPGLYDHEKKGLRFAAISATFYFVMGILFGYLVLTPVALQFFSNFTIADNIINEFDISRYFSMILMWCFGAGLLFELPVFVYFLSVLGVLYPQRLRAWRRYAIVTIVVIAAFITPPDPISQILMAIPLIGLYELSILISARVERRRIKAGEKETLFGDENPIDKIEDAFLSGLKGED